MHSISDTPFSAPTRPARSCPDRFALLLAALLVAFGFATRAAWGQTPEQVNRAIDRGVDCLKSKQRINGSWDEHALFPPGGTTALSLLAMLSCDVPIDDDRVQKGLAYLETVHPDNTYVVALQTMVFQAADPKRYFHRIRANAHQLMQKRLRDGSWSYGTAERNVLGDNSNTQYAILGLQAASDAGVEVPEQFWDVSREYWERHISLGGGWGYTPGTNVTGSMTVAGISSLIITNRKINQVQSGVVGGKPVRCNGVKTDTMLERALTWMGRNFSVKRNPANGSPIWLYYYLYGLERAGRLSGRRFMGDHDWYREGVRYLLSNQRIDGSWSVDAGGQTYDTVNTAFALLFLSKGRIPILLNKLKYGLAEDWNNAPDDANNLTIEMERLWHKRLNWQVVDVGVATLQDMLQAPVLVMNGHFPPKMGDAEKKLLRDYVDQGGILIADSNCGTLGFDKGFRDLCKELFPGPGQELRRIGPEHAVWRTLFQLDNAAANFPLYGIEVGCRTGLFYSPTDLSCRWQHASEKESKLAMQLGANIIVYATGPEDLQDKLVERKVFENAGEDQIRRGYLHIAKLKHNGDWNPAPSAVRNLMESFRDVVKVDVIRQQRDIEVLDPNLFHYPLVYMQGRNRFAFSERERAVLKEYLDGGGVLFADSVCGSEGFTRSFEQLCQELYPKNPLEPIQPTHELYSNDIGYNLKEVEFGKGAGSRKGPPLLDGVMVDGRYVIIFSRFDIGCALERHQASDCKGYTHESAIKIATNIILYALNQ